MTISVSPRQNIAPIKVLFFVGLRYEACDMSLRDIQTVHVSNMLAWDSIGNFARFGKKDG